jgi:chemotaxis signal transduction protein
VTEAALPLDTSSDAAPLEQPLESPLRSDITRRYGVMVGTTGVLVPEGRSEVFADLKVEPLPMAPSALVGLTNIRGTLVPVFDLAKVFDDVQVSGTDRAFVLVIGQGNDRYGLVIQGYPHALKKLAAVSMPVLSAALMPYATDAQEADGQIWIEANLSALLARRATQSA